MKTLSALLTIVAVLASSSLVAGEAELVADKVAAAVKPMVIEVEPVAELEPALEPEPELISLGEFKLTAYCSCSRCCSHWAYNRPVDEDGKEIVIGAAGEPLTAGYSIAVDPKVIPYGTVLIIDGKEYEAQDCGGAIKNKRIDVYFNSHKEALEFGVQYAEIFITREEYTNVKDGI